MLEISPPEFSACQGPDVVVGVSWDASSVVKHGGVSLFVYRPGQKRTLWIKGGPKGTAQTGKWASDGWTVVLVNDQGKLLATRTLQTTPCEAGSG